VENDDMCLVYDFLALGTMTEHLYKGNNLWILYHGSKGWRFALELQKGFTTFTLGLSTSAFI